MVEAQRLCSWVGVKCVKGKSMVSEPLHELTLRMILYPDGISLIAKRIPLAWRVRKYLWRFVYIIPDLILKLLCVTSHIITMSICSYI